MSAREFEIYVVDEVKAALYWGAPIEKGFVVSRATDDCAVASCRACGVLHGIASAKVLEQNGLAARRV